jgi:2-C-methyl-D-erythritol 4-phosphate cytidylyltransferase / 2-C-methyl-D-erythritol 2,4-cyclodiphosphate synthase
MASLAALIVAAGSGNRAGGDVPKQYRRIGGKTVLRHAAEALAGHPAVDELRVVIGAGHEALYQQAMAGLDAGAPVFGGAERARSVIKGLEAVRSERVLIHDAARPFCPSQVIDRLLAALDAHDAAVPVLPVADTLARGQDAYEHSLDRRGIVRVQTPQAFHTRDILQAYQDWRGGPPSDESMVGAAAGLKVAFVEGDPMLEKLTYPADFARAETLLGASRVPRTGFGFDVHAFAAGRELWLGGIRIEHDRGLAGHSDADVALHALTDALLGAIGAGDIGDHFPPSDPRWRGASSDRFLAHARDMIEARGGTISHVDLTIICETPRIGPYKARMRERVAALLRLPLERTSIKATTTERLGFTGRGEGIAAQAVATVLIADG